MTEGNKIERHLLELHKALDLLGEQKYKPVDVTLMDGSLRKNVLVPSWWSQMQADTAVSHYCQGTENMRDVFHRVATWVAGCVDSKLLPDRALVFECINSVMYWGLGIFNSPMQYNAGIQDRPQVSACFISSVQDSMESIMDWARRESVIFKGGSGSGCNPSTLRGCGEPLSRKGVSTGALSFIKALDGLAGTIKSGGRNRRAARMVVLDHKHPDIMEFIQCKAEEEKKAAALMRVGYSSDEARAAIDFQNGNHSVRLTDQFMQQVKTWKEHGRDGTVLLEWRGQHSKDMQRKTVAVSTMWQAICEATWACGDPGLHFQDRINDRRTTVKEIRASNPCSEFVFKDNSACNLASLNLIRIWRLSEIFVKNPNPSVRFLKGVKLLTTLFIVCQDAVIDHASYPTPEIEEVSREHRPLGLNFTNLGAWLMSMGLPYGSTRAQDHVENLVHLMTKRAWETSHELGAALGTRIGAEDMKMLRTEVTRILGPGTDPDNNGLRKIYPRNSQVTLSAPTGCLVGDTPVLTSEGLLPIQDLGNVEGPQWQDHHIKVKQEKTVESSTKFFVNGLDDVITVRTQAGHEITGTTKHKLRVIDVKGNYVWKMLRDITPDDTAVMVLGGHEDLIESDKEWPLSSVTKNQHHAAKTITTPKTCNPKFAELLGFYQGNGTIDARHGLRLFVCDRDQDVVDALTETVRKVFDIESKEDESPGVTGVRSHSIHLYHWWEENGLRKPSGNHGKGAAGAFIPDQVLRSGSVVLGAFLRGLFESDGTINLQKQNPTVEFSTVSPRLCSMVFAALWALGIPAKKTTQAPSKGHLGKRTILRIRISGRRACRDFQKRIGFMSKRKSSLLTEGVNQESSRTGQCRYYETIKNQALVDDLYVHASGLPEVRRDIYPRKNQARFSCVWASDYSDKYPDKFKDSKWVQISNQCSLEDGVYFSKVVDVSNSAEKHLTYDISVPENNCYVANGFVSHNTISFVLGYESTGIEPLYSLVSQKTLVGGKVDIQMPVRAILDGLLSLNGLKDPVVNKYLQDSLMDGSDELSNDAKEDILQHIKNLPDEHKAVFACAMANPVLGIPALTAQDHLGIMAAAQKSLSGAISKTVNLPEDATVEDISNTYIQSWDLGLKAVAVYRDKSKVYQPVITLGSDTEDRETDTDQVEKCSETDMEYDDIYYDNPREAVEILRRKMPRTRPGNIHKIQIGNFEGYVIVGVHPETLKVLEVFIETGKSGSMVNGFATAFATTLSVALQYNIPLEIFVEKFKGTSFPPQGFTGDPDLPYCHSIIDYVVHILEQEQKTIDELDPATLKAPDKAQEPGPESEDHEPSPEEDEDQDHSLLSSILSAPPDGKPCPKCGTPLIPDGKCGYCTSCKQSPDGCSA